MLRLRGNKLHANTLKQMGKQPLEAYLKSFRILRRSPGNICFQYFESDKVGQEDLRALENKSFDQEYTMSVYAQDHPLDNS